MSSPTSLPSAASPVRQLAWLLLLVLVTAPGAQANRKKAGIRAQFVRAMNEATRRVEEDERQTSLMTRLLESAKPVKTAFVRSTADQQNNDQQQQKPRDLQNYNYQYGYYNYQYDYGDDQAAAADDAAQQEEGEEEANEDDSYAAFGGLNLTKYALKYLGCQNIHTYSDDMAADGDEYGILAMNRFVVFRLCPKKSCSNYNDFGCEYNYGEYTIPMDDYLATMQYYHISQYQQYCQTCQSCMTTGTYNDDEYYEQQNQQQDNRNLDENNYNYNNNYNNNYNENYNGDDAYGNGGGQYYNYDNNNNNYNNANGDDAANGGNNNNNNANGDDDANAAAADDDDANAAAADDDDAAAAQEANAANATDDDGITCVYADVCETYKDACDAEMFTDDNYISNANLYSQYFECAEFNVGGAVSYLGPHCRSDGFTIGIGIYEDQYCSSYVGDMVDMQEVTGQAFDDEYLSPYYPKQCISCMASESYDLLTDDEMENENGGVYEVCGALYEQAAKCNIHMNEDYTFEGTYEQAANQNDVCNFVESLIENNYDEYGEAYLESPGWELSKWKQINAYTQDIQAVTSIQLLGIVFSAGTVVVLGLYILYLRLRLSRRIPWTFGYGKDAAAEEAGRIGRAGSGITMQRSLSGLDPAYSY